MHFVFSKTELLANYGSHMVKAGLSKHIPRNSGDGYISSTLEDFVAGMSSQRQNQVADDPLYVSS
jgi:hypothetical protein